MDNSDTKFGRFSLISSEHSRTEYRQFMKKNCAVVFILGSHFSVMKMFWNLSLGLMFCISKREECKQDNLPPPALPTTKCIQFISKDVVVAAYQPVQKTKYAYDNTYPHTIHVEPFQSKHAKQIITIHNVFQLSSGLPTGLLIEKKMAESHLSFQYWVIMILGNKLWSAVCLLFSTEQGVEGVNNHLTMIMRVRDIVK